MSLPEQSVPEEVLPKATADSVMRMGRIGVDAVEFAENVAGSLVELPSDEYSADLTRLEEQLLDAHLAGLNVAGRYLSADQGRLTTFYRGVEALDPPKFLTQALGATGTYRMVHNAMLKRENPRGRVNFAQWYNAAISEKTQQFERESLPGYIDNFQGRLLQAEASRVVAPGTLDRFTKKVESKKLHVMFTDISTVFDGVASARTFQNGESVIQIGNSEDEDEIEHTLTHEFGHTIDGTANPQDDEDPTLIDRDEKGLGRIFGSGLGGMAIGEATDELLADSMINGNIDELDPLSPARENYIQAYQIEEYFLAAVCTSGTKRIDPRVFTRAATADGEFETSPELRELVGEVEEAYPGMNLVERIRSFEVKEGEDPSRTLYDFARELIEGAELRKASSQLVEKVG